MTRLRELRIKTGKSIKEIANEIGIAPNYISQIERGERELNPRTLKKFCDYYKVKPNELLEYDDLIMIDENTNEFSKEDVKFLRLVKQLGDSDKYELNVFVEYLIFKHQRKIEEIRNNDKKGN